MGAKKLFSRKFNWTMGVVCCVFIILYFQPWRIISNSGEIHIIICKPSIKSENIWEYKQDNELFETQNMCKTSRLRTMRLNYKVIPEKQKVVFSGKEIGIVSYECNIYDRNNFICPDQDIGVENGKAFLYFNKYETAVPKWRYLLIKANLYLDSLLNNESIYKTK